MRSIGRPFMKKGRLRAFLKDLLLNGLGITQLDQKQVKNNAGAAQGIHLK
jgi:hypothetical protein